MAPLENTPRLMIGPAQWEMFEKAGIDMRFFELYKRLPLTYPDQKMEPKMAKKKGGGGRKC